MPSGQSDAVADGGVGREDHMVRTRCVTFFGAVVSGACSLGAVCGPWKSGQD